MWDIRCFIIRIAVMDKQKLKGIAMDKKIFFGLVGINKKHEMDDKEYELYLINDTDNPITLVRKAFGGFKTYDEDIVVMATPKDDEVNVRIKPHSYVFYCAMIEGSAGGANQYEAYIKADGVIKKLWFHTDRGAGFLGSLIPVVNKYGRVIHPYVSDTVDIPGN